jgi:hypothetical protein
MNATHYIGLDVHKKTISYCIKTAAGQIVKEGTLAAGERGPGKQRKQGQPDLRVFLNANKSSRSGMCRR